MRSPQLFQDSLFRRSGHWDHYRDHMYPVGESMVLKPMNCPAHVQIFNAGSVSHRQLPMRLAEFGCCHRAEPSGSLHGIMRLRQFVQDDAHIFCREDQIDQEVSAFCRLLLDVYRDFGFEDVEAAVSLRPAKRAGDEALWDRAEDILQRCVSDLGLPFAVQPGDGAFYGPKIEFALRDVRGRSWQCGTLQLDFVLPERLGARFVDEDGRHKVPVMLHRAILGSMERFIGILLEHHAGRLPDWLAPVQAVVVPVSPANAAYAGEVARLLRSRGRRVQVDDSDDHMKARIKRHSELLVPAILVVGDREAQNRSVAVRRIGSRSVAILPMEDPAIG